QIFLLIGYQFF
ncbi:hypothetical protein CP02DC14_1322B, partial [Chlamydia psittaci 02DC14]